MLHPMLKMMFKTYRSRLGFDETVQTIQEQAEQNGWEIPYTYDLQEAYKKAGHEDMTRCTVLYFCNPHGGYDILQEDKNKTMSVMMPTGVTIYETSTGVVQISAMNFKLMHYMFGGTIRRVLKEAAGNMAATLGGVVDQ